MRGDGGIEDTLHGTNHRCFCQVDRALGKSIVSLTTSLTQPSIRGILADH